MKKLMLYIALLTAALAVPVQKTDVGKLIPVEAVFLYTEDNQIALETDTGDKGSGETVKEAAEDLHESAAGHLYLDTADYLLVEESAAERLVEIAPYLKRTVRVCEAEQGIDLAQVSEYLRTHRPNSILERSVQSGITEKIVYEEDGVKKMQKK